MTLKYNNKIKTVPRHIIKLSLFKKVESAKGVCHTGLPVLCMILNVIIFSISVASVSLIPFQYNCAEHILIIVECPSYEKKCMGIYRKISQKRPIKIGIEKNFYGYWFSQNIQNVIGFTLCFKHLLFNDQNYVGVVHVFYN